MRKWFECGVEEKCDDKYYSQVNYLKNFSVVFLFQFFTMYAIYSVAFSNDRLRRQGVDPISRR